MKLCYHLRVIAGRGRASLHPARARAASATSKGIPDHSPRSKRELPTACNLEKNQNNATEMLRAFKCFEMVWWPKYFVKRSAGFTSPCTLLTTSLLDNTSSCNHNSRVATCLMRPKPLRETNDLAALESVNKLIGTFELNSHPISRATVCTPLALIAPRPWSSTLPPHCSTQSGP